MSTNFLIIKAALCLSIETKAAIVYYSRQSLNNIKQPSFISKFMLKFAFNVHFLLIKKSHHCLFMVTVVYKQWLLYIIHGYHHLFDGSFNMCNIISLFNLKRVLSYRKTTATIDYLQLPSNIRDLLKLPSNINNSCHCFFMATVIIPLKSTFFTSKTKHILTKTKATFVFTEVAFE